MRRQVVQACNAFLIDLYVSIDFTINVYPFQRTFPRVRIFNPRQILILILAPKGFSGIAPSFAYALLDRSNVNKLFFVVSTPRDIDQQRLLPSLKNSELTRIGHCLLFYMLKAFASGGSVESVWAGVHHNVDPVQPSPGFPVSVTGARGLAAFTFSINLSTS